MARLQGKNDKVHVTAPNLDDTVPARDTPSPASTVMQGITKPGQGTPGRNA